MKLELPPLLVIGLTGGVASGKTAVADTLAATGVGVVDTDVLAREVVAAGSAGLAELVQAFGSGILRQDGTLDRRQMRERVFADAGAKAELEAILHPRIRELSIARVATVATAYAVLVVPLLVESGRYDWVDRVLVVDVDPVVQRERLLARDGISVAVAEQMLAAQASRSERLLAADEVIRNVGTREQLQRQTLIAHCRYLTLATFPKKRG
jgi:dephospho-CoA kinase